MDLRNVFKKQYRGRETFLIRGNSFCNLKGLSGWVGALESQVIIPVNDERESYGDIGKIAGENEFE